jgi:hypothetical protein
MALTIDSLRAQRNPTANQLRMDYLLTWNCTHIANATLRGKIESVCRSKGYEAPIICTPEELLEE